MHNQLKSMKIKPGGLRIITLASFHIRNSSRLQLQFRNREAISAKK